MNNKFLKFIFFVFSNFGPLVVFYAANHFWGLKPAIITSLVFTAIEVAYKLIKKEKIELFFVFCVVVTVVFGTFDLYMQKSVLFRFEPALTNLFVGCFFGFSLFGEKSLIQQFAEKSVDPSKFTIDHVFYFRVFTIAWTIYYVIKSAVYVWVGAHYTIEQGLMIRITAGNISDYTFIAVSVLGGRFFFSWMRKANLLPSQKAAALKTVI